MVFSKLVHSKPGTSVLDITVLPALDYEFPSRPTAPLLTVAALKRIGAATVRELSVKLLLNDPLILGDGFLGQFTEKGQRVGFVVGGLHHHEDGHAEKDGLNLSLIKI